MDLRSREDRWQTVVVSHADVHPAVQGRGNAVNECFYE